MTTMTTVYLALGSNLGDRSQMLESAIERLGETPGVRVRRRSSIIETEPMGPPGQQQYLNAAVEIRVALLPEAVLEECLRIEREHDRDRRNTVRWGPRTLDIDVLLYGAVVLRTADLTIPHPGLHERDFVLRPLVEIAADVVHPRLGRTIESLWDLQRGAGSPDHEQSGSGLNSPASPTPEPRG